ncbi:MAG TPA: SMP-30/gluconolactonase/LRE family protein [Gemmatimonadales bacterium]|nr:SMP-30/gluconolactonase/LRE family protein [Gemmatimonadales bacterium]
MSLRPILPTVLLTALMLPATLVAQSDPVAESRAHYHAAVEAYEARDLPLFLDHARQAQALRPTHGGVTWALASALALNGDREGALRTLHHFAALGYSADLAADSDFTSLRDTEAYSELVRRLKRNREPLVASRPAFELPERDLLAEGIAYDAGGDVFYVGSVRKGRIFRVSRGGEVSEAATLEGMGLAPLGLRVDDRRRVLWVAAAALPQSTGYQPSDSGRSAILRFDLRTRRFQGRYEPPPDGRPHLIGDLVVSRAGALYATDSRAPIVYRLAPGAGRLEPFVESPLLLSAQGLALAPDERTLYVADYARGLLRVDLRARDVSMMETTDGVLALGIDGLYFHRGGLVGIQNGVVPHRVARFTFDTTGRRLVRAEVLERAHPSYQEPTLGVLVDDELFYVANSQWERFGQDGGITDAGALERPVVLRLPL